VLFALVLAACAPRPGEAGDHDCTPYLVPNTAGSDCAVWECYVVDEDGTVEEWYAWGGYHGGAFDHSTTRCANVACLATAEDFAIRQSCGVGSS
jgi:hypothetical protein